MERTGYIYALIDPRDKTVRYVGQTRSKPTIRLAGHYQNPTNARMAAWFEDMKAHNVRPYLHVLECPIVSRLDAREHWWIVALCTHKAQLLNKIDLDIMAYYAEQGPWPISCDLYEVIPDPAAQ